MFPVGHAALTTFEGRLLDRVRTLPHVRAGEGNDFETVLMLQRSNLLFSAQAESSPNETAALTELFPGAPTAAYMDALVRTPAFTKEVTGFSTGVWSSRFRLYPEPGHARRPIQL